MNQDLLNAALHRIRDVTAFGRDDPTGEPGDDRQGHFWLITDDRTLLAVRAALVTGRPLMVEGPPGSGKSSLARAVSESLGWTYYEVVVTSQTRLDQLTGWVDYVQRLHHAELAARAGGAGGDLSGLDAFVQPGVLWWALDPASATTAGQGGHDNPGIPPRHPMETVGADDNGAVVLIDEIDKAEPDLPNNLLVPLGTWQMRVEGRDQPVGLRRPVPPLVVVSSNQERDMPAAFLRRCVMLRLGHPQPDQLVTIAERHVVGVERDKVEMVGEKLAIGDDHQVSAAEFVDAVRAAVGLGLDQRTDDETWDALRSIILGTAADTDTDTHRARGRRTGSGPDR